MKIIKPLANTITLTTANTINDARLVYIFASTASLITVTSNTNVVKGSIVVPPNNFILIEKERTDTLTANLAVSATSVAYKD